MSTQSYDVLIVGGGVMGCATAYYLLQAEPQLTVAILEMDATYAKASTPLSDGNTRIQFNIKENILTTDDGRATTVSQPRAGDGPRPLLKTGHTLAHPWHARLFNKQAADRVACQLGRWR